jgi:hypothetical protein
VSCFGQVRCASPLGIEIFNLYFGFHPFISVETQFKFDEKFLILSTVSVNGNCPQARSQEFAAGGKLDP